MATNGYEYFHDLEIQGFMQEMLSSRGEVRYLIGCLASVGIGRHWSAVLPGIGRHFSAFLGGIGRPPPPGGPVLLSLAVIIMVFISASLRVILWIFSKIFRFSAWCFWTHRLWRFVL